MPNVHRISAAALLLMALGLGLLYHHAPYFWAARVATIVGALLPAVYLARRMQSEFATACATVIAMMLCWTLAAGLLVSDPWLAFRPYQFSVVASQWLLVAIWCAWARDTAPGASWRRKSPIALLGASLAATGAILATVAHWVIGYGDRLPPEPWHETRSNGPTDMLSIVAPGLLVPEMIMIAIAVMVAAPVLLLVRR